MNIESRGVALLAKFLLSHPDLKNAALRAELDLGGSLRIRSLAVIENQLNLASVFFCCFLTLRRGQTIKRGIYAIFSIAFYSLDNLIFVFIVSQLLC